VSGKGGGEGGNKLRAGERWRGGEGRGEIRGGGRFEWVGGSMEVEVGGGGMGAVRGEVGKKGS